MSLGKKKQGPKSAFRRDPVEKEVVLVGSVQDMTALGEALEQLRTMFNIDVERDEEELPTRISFSPGVDADPTMYPKAAKALKILAEKLQTKPLSDKESAISVPMGGLPLLYVYDQMPKQSIARVLQYITYGTQAGSQYGLSIPSNVNYDNVIPLLDGVFKEQPPQVKKGIFEDLNPEWVYMQVADVHPLTSESRKKRSTRDSLRELREMEEERLKATGAIPYPANFGKVSEFKGGQYTQGYVAIMRGDKRYPMKQKIDIDSRRWNKFVESRVKPGMLDDKLMSKPETMEDLMKFFFAYNVAHAIQGKKVALKPMEKGRSEIEISVLEGRGKNVARGPEEIEGDKVFYTALVVSQGDFLPNATNIDRKYFYDTTQWVTKNVVPGWS